MFIDLDKWQEINANLKANKLRTFLTAFGVFWGILMLIVLLGMGKGLANGQGRWLGSDDPNSIWIRGRQTSLPWQGLKPNRNIQFEYSDLHTLKNLHPNIAVISAENRAAQGWQSTVPIVFGKKSANFAVLGVDHNFFAIKRFLDLHHGRFINALDQQHRRKVAIMGTKVAETLFGKDVNPVGKRIEMNGVSLSVIGVFYDSGWQGRLSERIYIPLSSFETVYGRENRLDLITLVPKKGVDAKRLEQKVLADLKQMYQISPKDVRALRVDNLADTTKNMRSFNTAIGLFIWFVGLGTLTAGIVGISNIMIITVKDRTREIGVRKAMGASPASIINMILTESIVVTTIAGYFGLLMGIGILEIVDLALTSAGENTLGIKKPQVNLGTAFSALAVLVVAGTIAGLAPALRAARILPIEAMREE